MKFNIKKLSIETVLFFTLLFANSLGCTTPEPGKCIPNKFKYSLGYAKENRHAAIAASSFHNVLVIANLQKQNTITIREATSGNIIRTITTNYTPFKIRIHPTKKMIALLRHDSDPQARIDGLGLIEFWNFDGTFNSKIIIPKRKYKFIFQGKEQVEYFRIYLHDAEFSPNGKYITISHSGTSGVELRDLSNQKDRIFIGSLPSLEKDLFILSTEFYTFTPDFKSMILFHSQGQIAKFSIVTYDISTNKKTNEITEGYKGLLEVSTDGESIFSLTSREIYQWNLKTKKHVATIRNSSYNSITILNNYLAAGDRYGNIVFRDIQTGQNINKIPGKCPDNSRIQNCEKTSQGHQSSITRIIPLKSKNMMITAAYDIIAWSCQ